MIHKDETYDFSEIIKYCWNCWSLYLKCLQVTWIIWHNHIWLWKSVYCNLLKNIVHTTWNWNTTLDDISSQDKWSDEEHKYNYETVSANVLFILARWLREMTLSCWIHSEQHNEWVDECDSVLHDLQTELMNQIWIMNWNWWTWSHDKTIATDWCK